MARLYIGGPSGCGKTAAIKIINSRYSHISCLSGSQIMMRAAGVLTREELNLLPEAKKNTLRETAFSSYYAAAKNLILEGHFYLTEIDARFINSFVFVEASADSLIRFRKSDESRIRSTENSDISEEFAGLEKRIKDFEDKFRVSVVRIANDSTLDKLVSKILALYSTVSGAMY